MIFNICEALKNRDKQNDCKYDFLTTYQCNKYSNNTKRELIENLNNNCSDKKLEFILSRTANTEKIDLSEKFLEQFDSLDEKDSEPLNIHYYALVNTVKENGISKPTILNVCTASSIDKALMFLDPVDSEYVIEISEQKYDDYFKGQDILDEGAIWDAVKNGVKGVADAVKNINAERKNTDSYRIKQEIKDKKKDLRVAKEMEKAAKDSAKYGYRDSDSSNQSNNSASSNSTSNDINNNSNSTSFKAGYNPTFNRSRTSSNPSREEVLSPELIQQLIDSGDEATLQNIKIQAEKARQEAKKNNDKLEAEEKARKKQEEEKARKAAEADRAAAEAQSSNINQNEEFTKMGRNLTESESLKESLNLNEAKNIINVLNKNLRVRFKHSAGGIFSLDRTPFNTDIFDKLIKNNYKSIGDILEEKGLKYDISEDAYISKDENLYVTIYGDTNGIIVQFEEMESESLKESVNSDIVSMIKKQFPKATVKTSVRKHSDVHKSNPDTPVGKTKYVDIRITPDSASSVNSILQYCNHNIKKVLSSDERFDYYGDVPARNPHGGKEVILSYQDYSGLSADEYNSLLGESLKEFLNNDITELEDGVYQYESTQLPGIGDKKKALSSNINQNEEFTKMNDIFKALNEADDCINKDTHLYEQDALTYKNDQDLEEKVERRLRQIFKDFDIDSSEAMQFSKWQEVVDWISSVIKQLKDTPLTEDLSQEEIHTSGISAYITDAINGEYDTINDYNEMLLALKDDSQDSAISVIEDIIKEEYTHIGQLQELLKMYASPSSEIKSGEVEAQKQIEETKDDQSDSKFDNEFGLNSGFDSFI